MTAILLQRVWSTFTTSTICISHSFDCDFLAEDKDYLGFNKTVPLTLGGKLTLLNTVIIDDTVLENYQEYYLIWMEVPEQPMFDMILVVSGEDQDVVTILDDEGKFHVALLFNIDSIRLTLTLISFSVSHVHLHR